MASRRLVSVVLSVHITLIGSFGLAQAQCPSILSYGGSNNGTGNNTAAFC